MEGVAALADVLDEVFVAISSDSVPEPTLSDVDEMRQIHARVEGVPVVYLLLNEQTNLIKIGRSKRLKQRMKTLSREQGYPVQLLSYMAAPRGRRYAEDESRWLERDLHQEFALWRVTGEWFVPAPEIFRRFGVEI